VNAREQIGLFEKPRKEDFVQLLTSILDEARGNAIQKASAIQKEITKGMEVYQSWGFIQEMEMSDALLPIHKECVARSMELVADVAQRSDLRLSDLCTTAERLLKSRVSGISDLVFREPHGFQAPYTGLSIQDGHAAAVSLPFARQIDDGLRAVHVGYIRERSIPMPAAQTVQAKALRMLQAIYERTQRGTGGIDIAQVRELLGLSIEDANAGWTYLIDKNLITTFNIPTIARINAYGVDAIEAALQQPDKTTPIFPSVTYNVTIHGTGAGSQVNVATSGSSQVSHVSQVDPAIFDQFIDGVRTLVEQTEGLLSSTVGLGQEQKDQATALLAELRQAAETASPDAGRLRRGLESLRHVMEHAAGHVVGMGVLAGIEKLLALSLGA